MTHTYNIHGITCSGCVQTVEKALSALTGVTNVKVDQEKSSVVINMNKHIATSTFQQALAAHPKFSISEKPELPEEFPVSVEEKKTWLQTYKPILLVFGFILVSASVVTINQPVFSWFNWMNYFMAGFFLVFSFFKLLDLNGFADSYAMYDVVAKRWKGWGYMYPFIEFVLGIAFLVSFQPLITNALTFAVMSISIVGVLQSLINKRKIRCACLGAVFNLPMSTITVIEDALMILMSGLMIIYMI